MTKEQEIYNTLKRVDDIAMNCKIIIKVVFNNKKIFYPLGDIIKIRLGEINKEKYFDVYTTIIYYYYFKFKNIKNINFNKKNDCLQVDLNINANKYPYSQLR